MAFPIYFMRQNKNITQYAKLNNLIMFKIVK